MSVDKIYFRILDYYPSDVLGISYNSIKNDIVTNSGEIIEKSIYKTPYFDLIYSENSNSTIVNGSIRKFYFGKNSVKDFESNEEFKVALYLLSKELKISYKKLLDCSIYGIEIGKNFLVNISPAAIVKSIQKFSVIEPKVYRDSITFVGSNYNFIVYDKVREIINNNNGIDKELIEEKYKNENYLRIELRLKNRKAIRSKLYNPNIETLHDILALYDIFPYLLFHEIKRLEFSEVQLNTINDFKGNSINEFKEYLSAIGINSFGLDNALNMAIKLQGVEKSLNNRRVFKKKSGLVKLKVSSKNINLLESFKEQLNVTDEGLTNVEILSDEFCFAISENYENNIRKNL